MAGDSSAKTDCSHVHVLNYFMYIIFVVKHITVCSQSRIGYCCLDFLSQSNPILGPNQEFLNQVEVGETFPWVNQNNNSFFLLVIQYIFILFALLDYSFIYQVSGGKYQLP